ncbi:Tetratricopeptide repeat (TPR)-like superfamily protein [Hibiscus syriacus]|uniref:Tetratricopeptide repeat (TPR)-like superfamily protein n=1 Tax=Hibiscus syriacus TaxID=106335 RepID=A0A6A2Y3H3_HIBSY|nr:Tetratricopeptide repeat (TPR)-like superfamily protein [Hibiscus syriacus]
MNPLTLLKRLQNINAKEADVGISEEASWHAKYKDSAYIFVGGLPYDLTEDNLNGAQILGRILRVDHAEKYKKKEEEEQKKREARGVCYAFQRGECTRGAGCKFSHDEQKGAVQEGFRSARGNEKASEKSDGRDGKRSRRYNNNDVGPTSREDYNGGEDRRSRQQNDDDPGKREEKRSRRHNDGDFEPCSAEDHHRKDEKRSRRHGDDGEYGPRLKEDKRDENRSKGHDDDEFEPRPNGDRDRRGEKRSLRNESESYPREDRDKRGAEKRSGYNRNSSSHRHGERSYHEDQVR